MSDITKDTNAEPTLSTEPRKLVPDIPAGTDDIPQNRYGANIQLIQRRLRDEKRTADWMRKRKGK